MKKIFILLALIISNAEAAAPQLYNLSETDVKEISKEFSANFVHTIVAPASSYGKMMGLEIGFIGGATKTPNIDRVCKSIDSKSEMSATPTAGLIAGLSGPLGLGAELNLVPKISTDDYSFKNASAAFKWTLTSLLRESPIDIAARVHGSSSELMYSSEVKNASTSNLPVTTKMKWKNTSTGYNFSLSKKFLFIEPYVGFGSVSTKTHIGVSAATTVQIFTFSDANNYISNNGGSHYYGGVNLNLYILKIGAEYAKIMGVAKTTAKVSFYF